MKLLSSRVALNIYFWVFLFALKSGDANHEGPLNPVLLYGVMLFLMLFFVGLSYFNNLVLLPKLLFHNKRWTYILSILFSILVIAFIYTLTLKYLPILFPGIDPMDLSIVMSPLSNEMSFVAVVEDMQTYAAIMVVWITIFTLLGYYHHSVNEKKRLEALVNKHRDAELAFIKNQMNPHFLFNTLNNLYALSIKKSEETPEAILQLSTILRYVLYESDVPLISFEKEKEIIQAYIDIELLRVPQTPGVQFSIMADKAYQIPPLIWLPVIENVFKHGRSVNAFEIDFRLNIVQNKLHLYSKNLFKPQPEKLQTGGLGLSNLAKRLEWMFPNKHNLKTEIQGNYFIIDLTIDLG